MTAARWTCLLFVAAALAGCGEAAQERPNIVFIVADDLGYGDLPCYGAKGLKTPNLDRLATEGVRFTSFYANAPECSPTRTAFMTGRYQHRVGGLECAIGTGNVGRYDDAIRLRETHDLGLPVEEVSIARLLKDAGYQTAVYGKWHLGYEEKFFPRGHGFDDDFGPLGGGVDYFHHTEWDGTPVLYRNGKRVTEEGYITDLITAEAVKFIGRAKAPFFLYVPYTAPHTPYQGPNDKKEKPILKDTWNEGTREAYNAMVERMDEGIGKILKALDDNGLGEKTLVIFMSDNGANRTGSNAPFSGFKSGCYEGGIRVPSIVRWPGRVQAGAVSDQAVIGMDWTASMARVAGVSAPPGRPFDGIDILKRVEENEPVVPRTLFWRQRRGDLTWRAVRDGDLKYLSRTEGGKTEQYLFDLKADPAEKIDLLLERPGDARRLKRLLEAWEEQIKPRR